MDVTFEVSVPIVTEEYSYTNKAVASWGASQTAESNEVTVAVYEDWLRVGKIAYDGDGTTLIAPDEEFTFTLTLTTADAGSAPIDATYDYVGRSALGYEDMGVEAKQRGTLTMTGTSGDTTRTATFTLKAGQAITIFGIAPGMEYTVTEAAKPNYTSSGMIDRADNQVKTSGVIAGDTEDWVYFTNTSTLGELEISKAVAGGDTTRDFTFRVNLTPPADSVFFEEDSIGYTVDGGPEQRLTLAFSDGVYTGTLQLHDGQTARIPLPDGTQYSVTEDAVTSYDSSASTSTAGTVAQGVTAQVQYINTYNPVDATVAAPAVTKTLTGRILQADEFAFALSVEPTNGVTLPGNAKNAADGTVTFGDITFAEAGEYTVTVREVNNGLPGVAYDSHAYTVTYTVTDNNGTLEATAGTATGSAVFANTYNPNAATVAAPAVTKTLTGRDLQAGEFAFALSVDPETGVTLPGNAKNAADGTVTFGNITFAEAGEYTVTVREVNNGLPGVAYDSHAYTVTYTVTDNNGVLTATAGTATGAAAFANTYNPNAATVAAPTVTKTLTGRILQAGEFEFALAVEPETGVTLPGNAKNAADGTVTFGDITFANAGEYTVTVREVNNKLPGVAYDGHAYTVTYTVKDNNGRLEAAAGTATGAADFANIYIAPSPGPDTPAEPSPTPGSDTPAEPSPTPGSDTPAGPSPTPGSDTPAGSSPTPGSDTPAEPSPTPGSSTSPAPGTTPGQSGGGNGPDVPQTGDGSEPALWAAMAAGCLLALAAVIVRRRRKGHS